MPVMASIKPTKQTSKSKKKPRVLTAVQPSGALHLGNYFGAIKPMLAWQDKADLIFFIADLHALTSVKDAKKLQHDIEEVVLSYLACGIDPNKCLIFRQSDVYQVCLLSWILACLAPYGLLQRAHAFKEAKQQRADLNVGLFTYPALMAADILLYQAEVVPVGKDQQQHVEITRELARHFNQVYGEFFPLPKAQIDPEAMIIPGVDGRKMSKSYGNTIPLFAEEEEIKRLVMSFMTDPARTKREIPGNPDICPLFVLHKVLNTAEKEMVDRECRVAKIGCVDDKKIIFKRVMELLAPMRAERKKLAKKSGLAKEVLQAGAAKASMIADETLTVVKKMIGLTLS